MSLMFFRVSSCMRILVCHTEHLKHSDAQITSFSFFSDPQNEASISSSTRMLTVCSNHSSVTRLLGHVVQRATEMLGVRAYLHWYERYGMQIEEFQQAVNTLSGLIDEYESQ